MEVKLMRDEGDQGDEEDAGDEWKEKGTKRQI